MYGAEEGSVKGTGSAEAKSKVTDWGDKVDSGIGLPMINELESTLGWIYGEVIVNSGIGSNTLCFSLNSASDEYFLWRPVNIKSILSVHGLMAFKFRLSS